MRRRHVRRQVEEDDGVGPLEASALVAPVEEVALEDPPVAGDRGTQVADSLVAQRGVSTARAEQHLEVDDGQAGPPRDRSRELRLARSCRAEDDDALHGASL